MNDEMNTLIVVRSD